jgi:tryptophanyl-tRNA synthetase
MRIITNKILLSTLLATSLFLTGCSISEEITKEDVKSTKTSTTETKESSGFFGSFFGEGADEAPKVEKTSETEESSGFFGSLFGGDDAKKKEPDNKDKTAKGIASNHGLFSYPVLMAADILLFDSNIVPVGKDQIQHVEMARDIANTFNNTYGDILTMPLSKVDEEVQSVLGTDGAKMSKSYGNTIDMFGTKKSLKKQVMKIVTDSKELDEVKEYKTCNVYKLCQLFMDEEELVALQKRYETAGEGYGHFKLTLLDKINEYFSPYAEKREYYLNNKDEVKKILDKGAEKARKIAQSKMKIIREKVGLNY